MLLRLRAQTMTARMTNRKKKKQNKKTSKQKGFSSSTKWCITCKNRKRSMNTSVSSGTQRGGLSYLSQSCMRPAFNILCIRSGDGGLDSSKPISKPYTGYGLQDYGLQCIGLRDYGLF